MLKNYKCYVWGKGIYKCKERDKCKHICLWTEIYLEELDDYRTIYKNEIYFHEKFHKGDEIKLKKLMDNFVSKNCYLGMKI
jgi:hypothetical protein